VPDSPSALAGWLRSFFITIVFTSLSFYARERVLAMGILSVCLSVTTRYRFKPRWDRDSGFSPYDSL